MSKLTPKEAAAELSRLVANIDNAFTEAESFAEEYALEFHIEPAYGMGGWYNGGAFEGCDMGWNPSSQSC